MECPEPEALSAMASGGLASERRAAIADHAASCRACHAVLDALLSSRDADATVPSSRAAPQPDAALAATLGEPAAERAPARRLTAGDRVDRYVIEAVLGRGGMGVVYRARDPELGRAVAIKVLRRGMLGDRLRREAQALARLSHPNVVAVHDVGSHDGQPFIAMALVEGSTLRGWLRARRTPAELLAVLCAAGRGIAAAHAVGLIHRDLKPDNIFVSTTGQVLVGDFGLARGIDSAAPEPSGQPSDDALSSDLTRSGMILGTPAYMAPEQAAGDATTASDQFSFCVTAWEAFTGVRPFAGATASELVDNIRRGALIVPEGDRRIPARVAGALRRGLAADPARRFPSMTALLAALEPARRTRWLAAGGGLVAVAVVALASAFALRTPAPRPAQPALVCGDEAQLLATDWGPARRASVAAALGHRPGSERTTRRTLDLLDRFASAWLTGRRAACESARTAPDRRTYDDQLACFDRARTELGLVAGALETANELASSTATELVEATPPVERCSNLAALVHTAPPAPEHRATVERVRAALVRNRVTQRVRANQAWAELTALGPEVEALGYLPLTGELARSEAVLAYERDDYAGAEAAARHAIAVADQLRDDVSRASMAAVLAWILARQGKLEAAAEQVAVAEAAWSRAGKDPWIEIEILVARADASRIANLPRQLADSEALVDRIRAVYGPGSIRLAKALMELAPMYGPDQRERAQRAAQEATAIWSEQSGSAEQAEMTATSRVDQARSAGDVRGVIDRQLEVIAVIAANRPDSGDHAEALFELGTYDEQASRWADAARAYRGAVEIYDRHPELSRGFLFDALASLGRMLVEDGRPADGLAVLSRARAMVSRTIPNNRDDLSILDVGLARAYAGTGQPARAIALLEPQIEPLRSSPQPHHLRFGLACSTLAMALWSTGGTRDRDRARALAADAQAAWTRAIAEWGTDPLRTDQVTALAQKQRALADWLAAHR